VIKYNNYGENNTPCPFGMLVPIRPINRTWFRNVGAGFCVGPKSPCKNFISIDRKNNCLKCKLDKSEMIEEILK
jgi:hypothetical protein